MAGSVYAKKNFKMKIFNLSEPPGGSTVFGLKCHEFGNKSAYLKVNIIFFMLL